MCRAPRAPRARSARAELICRLRRAPLTPSLLCPTRRSEVNIYVDLPPGLPAKALDVAISVRHLTVGIRGNPPYLDVRRPPARPPAAAAARRRAIQPRSHTSSALPTAAQRDLGGPVQPSESLWTVEGGALTLSLAKAEAGATWAAALAGHEAGAAAREADQRRLLLERFQAEHPGFDFSGAEVTGAVPDARTFMRE